jgi:hypothetical protein
MTLDYFLSPASKKHNSAPYQRLEKTVVSGFSASDLSKHIDRNLTRPVRVWGFREGNKAFWRQMDKGDVILFYTGDEYEYAARVQQTERNQDFAEEVWGRLEQTLGGDLLGDSEPWPYLVFLQKLRKLTLQSSHLHRLIEYKQDHIVSTTRVTADRKRRVKEEYGSMAALVTEHTVKKYWEDKEDS